MFAADDLLRCMRRLNLTSEVCARLSETQAEATFRAMRWPSTNGMAQCPHCGAGGYKRTRDVSLKCKGCGRNFTVTSDTSFHHRKWPYRNILLAAAYLVDDQRESLLRYSARHGLAYKSLFTFLSRLRSSDCEEVYPF